MRIESLFRRKIVRAVGCFVVAISVFLSANTVSSSSYQAPEKGVAESVILLLQVVPIMQNVDKLGPTMVESLCAICSQCKEERLQLEFLIGWLCADGARDKLNEFKALVATLKPDALRSFIVTTANAKQIECMTCRNFHSWQ